MKLVKKILHRLNGLYYPQEYLCFARETFENPLQAYLVDGPPGTVKKKVIKDITKLHSFTGYSPLIISLPSSAIPSVSSSTINIAFANQSLPPNALIPKKDAIAFLSLKKIKEQQAGDEMISHYEGVRARHRFISAFHQLIIRLNNRLYNKIPGNVFLPGNLYTQVQVAYSLPRIISLVTIKKNGAFNLFPTDLHGPVNDDHYIISLRQKGKACEQVLTTGSILLTQLHSDFYQTAYALGKNHMREMKGKENFPFSREVSAHLQLPLPKSALFYRELELQDSFIHGIHRLMLFKTLYSQQVQDAPSTLAHIHNTYATWRHNKGLAGNYLVR